MSDPKRNPLQKQTSLSYIEQSLKITPPPPQQAPVTIYPGPKAGFLNLSKTDLELADRLEKLRKKDVPLPTEDEMASRLAELKGLPPDHYKKPSVVYQPPDNRTEIEKSDDLMEQVMAEVALEAKIPEGEDIETRLAKLRGLISTNPLLASKADEPEQFISPDGQPTPFLDQNEIDELLRDATLESKSAAASLKTILEDEAIQVTSKSLAFKRPPRRSDSTSSEERFSGDDSNIARTGKSVNDESKEKEEMEAIIRLYTQSEQRKKAKRKQRAQLKKAKSTSTDPTASSSSEESFALSSSSDIELSTSESEKLSD